jgi:hypothetical protein
MTVVELVEALCAGSYAGLHAGAARRFKGRVASQESMPCSGAGVPPTERRLRGMASSPYLAAALLILVDMSCAFICTAPMLETHRFMGNAQLRQLGFFSGLKLHSKQSQLGTIGPRIGIRQKNQFLSTSMQSEKSPGGPLMSLLPNWAYHSLRVLNFSSNRSGNCVRRGFPLRSDLSAYEQWSPICYGRSIHERSCHRLTTAGDR